MRFAKGKEAEKMVRQGVRALSREEKRKLGLSVTNTYYVREGLKRVSKRSVIATSRQVRQARKELGILTEMAARVRGKAGRPRREEAIVRANRDYREGRISFEEAKRQVEEWIDRSKASKETIARILFDRAENVTWYRKKYKDGVQFVINWRNREEQMTAGKQMFQSLFCWKRRENLTERELRGFYLESFNPCFAGRGVKTNNRIKKA